MFRSSPLLLRFTLFLLLPIAVLSWYGVRYVRSSQPQLSGQLRVAGLDGAVSIARDRQGAAHITASNEHDVYFAMGYAHAQDRLWQLELHRRIAQGRLSEVLGRQALQQDVWFRTLGLYQAAASAWPALSGQAQASLTAYAAGVNAWLASDPVLPPEFLLLGIRPAPWAPLDSLALVKIFALNLAGNLNQEVEHLVAGQVLDRDQMQSLYPAYPSTAPVTARPAAPAPPALAALLPLQRQIERQLQIGGRYVGSNAWVVSGRLSQDGKALLANDPHMSLEMPSLWYAVSQHGGALRASGMSLVGLPVVVFGANERIGWGGTSMMADVQDLYFEQVDALDARRYRSGDQWKTFATRKEWITVKPDFPAMLRDQPAPVAVEIRQTERGPLLSDVVGAFNQPVSLRWTALDDDDTSYEAFFRLSYAGDWSAFQGAMAKLVAPALNMLYIDRADNIGYLGAGRVPLRKRGSGDAPVNGWSGEYRWTGQIPAAEMPRSFNPPEGYIVSANNKVVGADYPYFISNDWAPPARAERIEQMLRQPIGAGRPLTPAYVQVMQSDVLDLDARRMLPLLTALAPRTPRQRQALDYLRAWNGEMAASSQAAAIYAVWMPQLRRALFARQMTAYWNRPEPGGYLDAVALNTSTEVLYQALHAQRGRWCGPRGAPACADILLSSLDDSLAELERLAGADMAGWAWGGLHAIRYQHTPFSAVRPLRPWFSRHIASGGAPSTVNAASAVPGGADGYTQNFGAAFRQVIRLGDGGHWYINSTGQSGHPFSPHFDDMIAPYGSGRYFMLDAAAGAADTLTLTPRR
ncbi:penicillin acylase family protein [Duganella violaceipulchra]|uniref:Penicillin acylase family protein n=1 Tax=Duganella violaceipulchra TaxID=2849652 RepID=A0AA41HKK3_9BURK|nr:penicillin acylase family protein [Duganella violaceicalia]MCP2012688.1 penicillin amidase [Duganella violaceicalia]